VIDGWLVWRHAGQTIAHIAEKKEEEVDLTSLVTRVRDLSRLETASMRVVHVGTLTQSYEMVPNALAGDELTFFATGDVIAGVVGHLAERTLVQDQQGLGGRPRTGILADPLHLRHLDGPFPEAGGAGEFDQLQAGDAALVDRLHLARGDQHVAVARRPADGEILGELSIALSVHGANRSHAILAETDGGSGIKRLQSRSHR